MGYTLVDCGSPGTINLNHCFYQRLQEAQPSFLPESKVSVALEDGEIKIHWQIEKK